MTEFALKVGQKIDFGELVKTLIELGYERAESVTQPGVFAVIGGVIQVYAVGTGRPVKLDFFGPKLEKIYSFEPEKNEKIENLSAITVPANQLVLADGAKVKPGDVVVHEDYGIGLFKSIGKKTVEGVERSYIFLEYLNGDMLYVPLDLLSRLSSYIGVGHRKPKLSKLGSQTWQKTYKKTYENALKMAKELLEIYAMREVVKGEAWKIVREWDRALAATFPYKKTPDQDKAIEDVFADITSGIPMDRLVAGDVGFGKTEVAIRAVGQAVANGFQAVILVPTTILAEQHYVTLKKRFAGLPVSIERLSRFIGGKEQKRIVAELAAGRVDILVGTHRLLAEDIHFKNLGLYVVDEEQRFGVKQKEKIKEFRSEVNVLSLSATPIPRTLFMALSGIRDISEINTPPGGRKDIETAIGKYDEKLITEHINREISRAGQIYYLHNEVSTIGGKKNQLLRQFPKLRIDVAHGQMGEEHLASTMSQFSEGKIDLLVCSTIIENGLDLANANTLIVENSDHFGLSQLYQIRGRIGRSPRQAYALFTYRDKAITGNAFKRLRALADNSELGSGFNVAMSDLEIRGGGNILGREQHGNMEAVGLVLYSRLLKMAVDRLKKRE